MCCRRSASSSPIGRCSRSAARSSAPQHAALAVLLMVGIAAFTVPTPDFGPVILAMPLWAIILLHYWRAVGEGRRAYWLPLALEIGLLLLTTYVGLILVGLLRAVHAGQPAGARRRSAPIDPGSRRGRRDRHGSASDLACGSGGELMPMLGRLRTPEAVVGNLVAWLRQMGLILAAHAGLVVLVALVAGWPWPRREPAPGDRPPADRSLRPPVRLFLRARAGLGGDPRGRADRHGRAGRRHCAAGHSLRPRGRGRGRRRHPLRPPARGDRRLVRSAAHPAGHGRSSLRDACRG